MDSAVPASARAALQSPDFRRYQVARFILTLGAQMLSVVLMWQVAAVRGNPLDVGLVGLAQFLPLFLLSPFTGDTADRFDKRLVLVCAYGVLMACALALFLLSLDGVQRLWPVYAVLTVIGAARAFAGPAAQSLVPSLVPVEHLQNAVSWSATVFRVATIAGPSVGGVALSVLHAPAVFALVVVLFGVATALTWSMSVRTGRAAPTDESTLERIVAGARFVWRQKVILGAISLDLFAVLLGGAVALLPFFAKDILHAGPWALGVLRSAEGVGAAGMAVWLAHHPLRRRAGVTMFASVAVFGLATVVFALSRSIALSVVALAVLGAADMVSVVLRLTVVQLATPPEMRGRVSAVNMLFIGASNELGEFESGLTARWLGVVRAAVVGGVGTLAVVALWAWRFPELRRISRPEDVRPA